MCRAMAEIPSRRDRPGSHQCSASPHTRNRKSRAGVACLTRYGAGRRYHRRRKAREREAAMTPNSLLPLIHEHLTDIACAALILVYAWDRFNTPSTNRSSTRRALYWEACLGYLVSALVLYAALSTLLGQADWRSLLGLQEAPALPAPLLAALVMTTLMP